VFPYDNRMASYLKGTARAELAALADRYKGLLGVDPEVEANPQKFFDRVIEIDLSKLEPYIVGPHSPDKARPVSQLAADAVKEGYPEKVSVALIGSCTNSSYEDISRAADVARQAAAAGVKVSSSLLVTPGSEMIRATIERDGQMKELESIGATVLANACGPCIGQWQRDGLKQGEKNTIITSFNRNFQGRNDGSPDTNAFIGSPEVVMAYGIAGSLKFNPLTDAVTTAEGKRIKLTPPKPAPELPPNGFIRDLSGYVAPPDDGSKVEVKVDPKSTRLQVLEPFPAWDGKDLVNVPILVKVKGKCTTDHISPAGPWLRFRGHLDKISDNMWLGATNAYNGEEGKTLNILSGERETPGAVARKYKAQGLKWVAIGDSNYGEGSSREHAAMSPRLLGCGAVIVRTFARIHESNLKKQGVLPFTFANPADWDKVREDDRISITGLKDLAPGKPVKATLHHKDGKTEDIQLKHTMNQEHIAWFKAGSALNVLRAKLAA
jgi:aconitate hydratase